MVCVPCFIIPLLLYIWHKFVQPILLRYWNPWEKKDAQGNVIKSAPEFPFECKGGVCPFVPGDKKQPDRIAGGAETGANTNSTTETATITTAATTTEMERSPSSTEIESKKSI